MQTTTFQRCRLEAEQYDELLKAHDENQPFKHQEYSSIQKYFQCTQEPAHEVVERHTLKACHSSLHQDQGKDSEHSEHDNKQNLEAKLKLEHSYGVNRL